jgi:hypothetical protein
MSRFWLIALSSLWAASAQATSGSVNYAIPDSPAFAFLGTSPTKVERPGSARDLAITVLSGLGSEGRTQQGFALDVRPWFLIPGLSIPPERYERFWYFVAANAQLSVGTVAGASDTTTQGDTDFAVGLRLTLVDRGDPMLSAEYRRKLGSILDGCAPKQPGTTSEGQDLACMHAQVNALRKKWLDQHWNASRVGLGLASGWRAPGSIVEDSRFKGLGAWLVAGTGLGNWAQLIALGRYDRDALVKTNVVQGGGRVNLGSGWMNAFAEATVHWRPSAPAGTDRFDGQWSGGLEVRIAEQTWISTGVSRPFAADDGRSPLSILANLRWGIANDARFSPSPAAGGTASP